MEASLQGSDLYQFGIYFVFCCCSFACLTSKVRVPAHHGGHGLALSLQKKFNLPAGPGLDRHHLDEPWCLECGRYNLQNAMCFGKGLQNSAASRWRARCPNMQWVKWSAWALPGQVLQGLRVLCSSSSCTVEVTFKNECW